MSDEVEFTFEGRAVRAVRGQTIAAVLMQRGELAWRTTRFGGRPRGIYCGMGVCFDCLITLNGEPNVRACLIDVEPGDDVRSQEGTGHVG